MRKEKRLGKGEMKIEKGLAADFGKKIARVMMKLKSSHCYFILQQAYNGPYLSWEEAEKIMKKVIKE